MNRLRKVVGNTIVSLLGQGVTWMSTLILTIAYGRFLGDVKFGELYFAITFVLLVGFPIEFGFNQQLTRDVAQEPERALRYLTNILCIKIILWMILYTCILLLCLLLGYPPEVRTLVSICGITLLSGAIANTMSSLHYAFERVIFPVVGTILEKGLTALIGVILLRNGASVTVMAFVLLGGSLASMLWQTIWVLLLVKVSFTLDMKLMRELVRKSIPFLVYGVLGVIYYRIDTILLSLMTSAAVVGWYGAGYRIFDTLVFLPSLVISAIMYPVFSKLSLHSESELKIAVEKSLNFLLFCGIPIATGLVVAAPNIIGFLYHRAEFAQAVPVLQYLAPGIVFLYINSVLTSVIMSTKREKDITKMALVALVFNLGLNLFMIARYQQIGAAAVTSLTELLLMGLALTFIPRAFWPSGSVTVGIKALIASLCMALAVLFMHQFNLLLILPVALIVYLAAAILLGTIPRDDLVALYSSVRSKTTHAASTIAEAEKDGLPLSEEIALLANEEILPEVLSWRMEMTDPALAAYGHDMKLPDTPSYSVDDDITLPRRAVHPEVNTVVDSLDEETVRLPRIPLNNGGETVRLPHRIARINKKVSQESFQVNTD